MRSFYKDPDAISKIKERWFPRLLDGNDYARIVAERKIVQGPFEPVRREPEKAMG